MYVCVNVHVKEEKMNGKDWRTATKPEKTEQKVKTNLNNLAPFPN
jgi:hypothetical protein